MYYKVLILLLVGSMTFALDDDSYGNPYGLSNDGMDLPYSPRYRFKLYPQKRRFDGLSASFNHMRTSTILQDLMNEMRARNGENIK